MLLEGARRLAAAAEAGDVDLVLRIAADQQAVFDQVRAETGPLPEPAEMERVRGLIEQGVLFLTEETRAAAAEIESLRAWRRCLVGYHSPAALGARFVDRKG